MTEKTVSRGERNDALVKQFRSGLTRVSGVLVPDVEMYGPDAVEFVARQEEAIDEEIERFRDLLESTGEVAA